MEQINEHSYSRTFTLGHAKGWFCASYQAEKQQFAVALELDRVSHLKTILTEIRRILDLDADPLVIARKLAMSGVDKSKLLEGIRIPGIWSPFEAGCRAILGQQISLSAGVKMVTQLVYQLGEKNQQKYYFPTPEHIASSDLTFLRMPESRRTTLRTFARFWAAQNGNDDVSQWLQIKGIGPWTVDYVKLRGLSHPNIWLATDLVIKKQAVLHRVQPETGQAMVQLSNPTALEHGFKTRDIYLKKI